MGLIKCMNGHFYNDSRFDSCPFCSTPAEDYSTPAEEKKAGYIPDSEATVSLDTMPMAETTWMEPEISRTVEPQMEETVQEVQLEEEPEVEEEPTVVEPEPEVVAEPEIVIQPQVVEEPQIEGSVPKHFVAGWLLGISGDALGQAYTLYCCDNYIKKQTYGGICVTNTESDMSLSNVMIRFEQNQYEIHPGFVRELSYVNQKPVLMPITMREQDVLSIGSNKFILKSINENGFCWEDYLG